ncbi:MAG: hypothetical protein ACW97Z_16210 [Candidatus Hodarchaeales archaeon]|jgi:hypothetical protein
MQKRNIQILSIGLFFLLFLMQSPQSGAASVSAYNAATIVVTAGSDALVVGTPIIIAGSEFSGDFALATAVVMDGATALPTQYDAGLDELVFQLPAAVAASGSKTFEVQADATGSSNGQSATITMGQGDYNETYSDWVPTWYAPYLANGTGHSTRLDSYGDVIWVETDWAVLCLTVEADWRQGTFKHVFMKNADWDAAGGFHNATTGNWRWEQSLFQDADEGWPRGGGAPDTIEIKKVGPVRAVIKAIANSNFKDNLGQQVQNVNATRTYTIYNGFAGIAQHFTITGTNATQAMTDFSVLNTLMEPMRMKHQLLDGLYNTLGSNNLTKVFVPGDATLNNETYTRGTATFNLSAVTDSYFAVYNDSDTRGYVYNWGPFGYLENLTNIDAGNQVVMNYAFDMFPTGGFDRYWTPFSTFTGDIGVHAAAVNDGWVASYTVAITDHDAPTTTTTTTTTTADGGPGFELVLVTLGLVGASVFIRKRR